MIFNVNHSYNIPRKKTKRQGKKEKFFRGGRFRNRRNKLRHFFFAILLDIFSMPNYFVALVHMNNNLKKKKISFTR